jgi:photosystem II stability/assembly factor-like uncharacterized protein
MRMHSGGARVQASGVSSDTVLRDVEAVGDGVVYACGDRGHVIKTVDAGGTWITQVRTTCFAHHPQSKRHG